MARTRTFGWRCLCGTFATRYPDRKAAQEGADQHDADRHQRQRRYPYVSEDYTEAHYLADRKNREGR